MIKKGSQSSRKRNPFHTVASRHTDSAVSTRYVMCGVRLIMVWNMNYTPNVVVEWLILPHFIGDVSGSNLGDRLF
jgi:hypothetical protein